MNLTLSPITSLKKWSGMATDAWHSFAPGWHWEQAEKLRCPKVWQFEKDCLQLRDEDLFLAMRLQPSGWQMSMIRDGKLIGSSFSGQFKVLFGVWSKLWASQLLFSRLQWERKFNWRPGSQMVIRANLDMSRFDDWRERLAARNASWYALRESFEPGSGQKPVLAKGPNGKSVLTVPAQFRPYLTHPYVDVVAEKVQDQMPGKWESLYLGHWPITH